MKQTIRFAIASPGLVCWKCTLARLTFHRETIPPRGANLLRVGRNNQFENDLRRRPTQIILRRPEEIQLPVRLTTPNYSRVRFRAVASLKVIKDFLFT
jgi:hypothetical protein